MGIPNAILKVINSKKQIVNFDISKIATALTNAILDVEDIPRLTAETRAKHYAEKISERIYNDFYSFKHIFTDFSAKYLSFESKERARRLSNALMTERLAVILLENYKELITNIPNTEININNFCADYIKKSAKQKYIEHLKLNADHIEEIASIIIKKTSELHQSELTDYHLYPTTEFIMDIVEKELKNIGEIKLAESFMLFREGRLKVNTGEISENQFTNNGIPYDIWRKTNEWNIKHDCENIFSLNNWVFGKDGKKLEDLIFLSEERFKNDILAVINKILDRIDFIKIIIIAGPSSSNKTTTTTIIKKELAKHGLKLKQLNVDDYYKNIEEQPKDEFGDFDFEMPEALDIALLNEHFDKLTQGKPIRKPKFNFKLERRVGYTEFILEKDEILLVDCLHGLYKSITGSVPLRNKFKIYLESMNVLRNTDGVYTQWTDIRLLKRMARDYKFRGYSPRETLAHWNYVRKGELKHIIPYIFSADAIINSGLSYELPALKSAVSKIFPDKKFIEKLRIQGRLDPYIRAIRLISLLETVAPIEDLSIVPNDSPLREFIGGSVYELPHNE
ncbi:MAG TPA: hypothetical protein PLM75_06195 [bacterium]|nr:hypothetical protein [bacterium]